MKKFLPYLYILSCVSTPHLAIPVATHTYISKFVKIIYPPLPVTVANEGLVRDPLLKMFHDPGGDWNPGRGGQPNISFMYFPGL